MKFLKPVWHVIVLLCCIPVGIVLGMVFGLIIWASIFVTAIRCLPELWRNEKPPHTEGAYSPPALKVV